MEKEGDAQKINILEDCIKAIELTNYYDNNGYTDIEDGSINIEEGNVFTNFYEGAIDLGVGDQESKFKIKENSFTFGGPYIPSPQSNGYVNENIAINGKVRKKFEVDHCTFTGGYPAITNGTAIKNDMGCDNLIITSNDFINNQSAVNVMVYGYVTSNSAKGTQAEIEDNKFHGNGIGLRFLDNYNWTYSQPGVVSDYRTQMEIGLHCNSFKNVVTPPSYPNNVGLEVENGSYIKDIGVCGVTTAGGNGWPVDVSSSTNYPMGPISGWNSPANWISIVDGNSSPAFIYTPYQNEFVGVVSNINSLPPTTCNQPGESFGSGSPPYTCPNDVDTLIIFAIPTTPMEEDAPSVTLNGYPNPTTGYLGVSYSIEEEFEVARIEVIGILGNVLRQSKQLVEPEGQIKFDLSDLPNGSHFLRIVVDGQIKGNIHVGVVK